MKKLYPLLVVSILVLSGLGAFAVAETAPIKLTIKNNNPPEKPWIAGPICGKPGVKYEYVFSTTDPENDDVSYYVEWGDGTTSGWTNYYPSGNDVEISHIWNKIDRYPIRCKAKDNHGAESDWNTFDITMPKNKAFVFNFPLLSWLFERFPNAFPILQHIFKL